MLLQRIFAYGLWLLCVWLSLAPADAFAQASDLSSSDLRALLDRAFEKRFNCSTRQSLTLVLRSREREVMRQRIEMATKITDGRLQAIGRFVQPPDLRDTALLMLEGDEREDFFLYLPALLRVRRVTGAQRSDSFMGTDLSYEDLRRPRVENYEAFSARHERVENEEAIMISARPLRDVGYERMEVAIAEQDAAILSTRYFKKGMSEPYKVIETPRAALHAEGDVSLPTRIFVRNLAAKTETEILVDAFEVNPDTKDTLFTTHALTVGRALPPISKRKLTSH